MFTSSIGKQVEGLDELCFQPNYSDNSISTMNGEGGNQNLFVEFISGIEGIEKYNLNFSNTLNGLDQFRSADKTK